MIKGAVTSTQSTDDSDIMDVVINKFNQNWKDGVLFLRHHGMDNEHIGLFIREHRKQLSPIDVSECLLNTPELLTAYIKAMDLEGYDFVNALRKLLTELNPKTNVRKYVQIMDAFGQDYYEKNKHTANFPFNSAAAVSSLAFSCLELNDDAFDSALKEKMTLKAFLDKNKKTNNDENFNEQFMASVYKDITRKKFNTDADPISGYEAWVKGQGGYKFGYLTNLYVVDPLCTMMYGSKDKPKVDAKAGAALTTLYNRNLQVGSLRDSVVGSLSKHIGAENAREVAIKMNTAKESQVLMDLHRTKVIVINKATGTTIEHPAKSIVDAEGVESLLTELSSGSEQMQEYLSKFLHQGGFMNTAENLISNYYTPELSIIPGPHVAIFTIERNGDLYYEEQFTINGILKVGTQELYQPETPIASVSLRSKIDPKNGIDPHYGDVKVTIHDSGAEKIFTDTRPGLLNYLASLGLGSAMTKIRL